MSLSPAFVNAKNFKPTDTTSDVIGLRSFLKELIISEYLVQEYPHVLLKFLPAGVLHIIGQIKQPIIHKYTVSHNHTKNTFTMTISPSVMNIPGTMVAVMMKNHVTLYSDAKDDQGNPVETLHLSKIRLKDYNSSK